MTGDYAAFISYRHRPLDTAVATRLHRLIEHYRIPKDLRQDGQKHVGRVFRDRDELPLSSDLTAELRAALDHSKFLIVICTPDTPQSIWVDREIEYFLRSHDRDNVLAVLAAGTQDAAFPKRLTEVYAEDGVTVVEQVEPLAANIADETNPVTPANWLLPHRLRVLWRLRGEFLRLMAALLHCPYDTLRQRRRQYILQRVLAATLAAAGVVAVFAGMLLDRNREIARQMTLAQQNEQRALASEAQAQENESRALALLSEQQLAGGDRDGALRSALAALPDAADPDRPYLVEAEKALADALYLYQPPALRQVRTVEEDTDLVCLTVTADGSRVICADSNSVLRCYDTEDGALLWTTACDMYPERLTVVDEHGLLLAVCISVPCVGVFDLVDGTLLADGTFLVLADGTFLGGKLSGADAAVTVAPDGQTLAFARSTFDEAAGRGAEFVFQDLYGGGDRTVPLTLACAGDVGGSANPEGVVFSPDGKLWAVMMVQGDDEAPQTLFVGDSASGQILGRWELATQSFYAIRYAFTAAGDLLVADAGGAEQWVSAYRPGRQEPLYRRVYALAPETVFERTFCTLYMDGDTALWVHGANLVRLQADSGEVLSYTALTDTAVAFFPADGDTPARLALADGSLLALEADGPVLCAQTGSPVLSMAAAGGGAVPERLCAIPADAPAQFDLYALLGDDRAAPMPEDGPLAGQTYLSLYPVPDGRSLLATGLFDWDHDRLTLLDAQTLTMREQWAYTGADLALKGLSADGTRALLVQQTVLDTSTGAVQDLTEDLPLAWQDEFLYYSHSAASPFLPGVPGLTVLMNINSDEMAWSRDAGPLQLFSYAGQGVWSWYLSGQHPAVSGSSDYLAAGNNGYLALALCDENNGPMTHYALYDTAGDAWYTIAVPPSTDCGGPMALGDVQPWFAVVGTDGTVCLYDIASGRALQTYDLALLPEYAAQLRFLDEDRLLLARATNGTMWLLDTAAGTVLCTCRFADIVAAYPREPDRGAMQMYAQVDAETRTLYLGDRAGLLTGLCLDMDSWQTRADIPGLMCYLPATRQVFCRDADSGLPVAYPVCTPEELAARARALLAP